MENSNNEVHPIVYVLGTLVFVAIIIAAYIIGTKNPLNLSIGEKSKPTSTPTVLAIPTEKPYEETVFKTATPTAIATFKANPNIFFLPTASPTPTIKPLQLNF